MYQGPIPHILPALISGPPRVCGSPVTMSYAPLGEGRTSPHAENIELVTKHDGQTAYGYPLHHGIYSDSKAYQLPGKTAVDNWPVQSQQVAALTPLRATILAFDFILASSPLVFIGMPIHPVHCINVLTLFKFSP